ncbi:MAG TPA: SDR family NAD(P)-dependent oxidoreductase [Pilimelia sp.]|nr:SDR family NAD(P)-dependent oxidoreductase [Pilimelia sp.]
MTQSTPPRWTADDIPDQSGRTVLVTGANSGLGLATTRALARRGAHVIMAVRDEAKGALLAGHARLDVRVNNAGIMVTVSSHLHTRGAIHFDDLTGDLGTSGAGGPLKLLLRLRSRLAAHSVEVGVRSQQYAATDPGARSGQYIGIIERGETRGHPAVEQPVESATDPALAARLWRLSEELTGVRFDLPAATGQPAG